MAGTIRLDVTMTKGAGATDAFILIDFKGVKVGANNKGKADVDTVDNVHDIQVVVRGPPGATLDWKVMQGPAQLAGGQLTVSAGKSRAGYVDTFTHV